LVSAVKAEEVKGEEREVVPAAPPAAALAAAAKEKPPGERIEGFLTGVGPEEG